MLLEVLHGHGGQVKELISHFEGTAQQRGLPDVEQNALNFIKNLKEEKNCVCE